MKFVLVLALSLVGLAAHAEEAASTSTSNFATPLAAGHWQIGGSAGWSSINNSPGTTIFAAPRAEYFLCDHVSLGAYLGVYFAKDYTDDTLKLQYTTVGPSATMYFSRSTIAPYITQQVLVAIPRTGKSVWGGISGAGVAFFANEHVSISPELDLTWAEQSKSDLSLNVRLATYL